jgi:hypothetical protein
MQSVGHRRDGPAVAELDEKTEPPHIQHRTSVEDPSVILPDQRQQSVMLLRLDRA